MHSVKLFKFLESVFDLRSPPYLLESNFYLSCSGSMLLWGLLACSPLLGIAMRVGKLVGFRVTATQVCARSLSVLAGK